MCVVNTMHYFNLDFFEGASQREGMSKRCVIKRLILRLCPLSQAPAASPADGGAVCAEVLLILIA